MIIVFAIYSLMFPLPALVLQGITALAMAAELS